jgi:hypothetical protein
MSFIKQIRDEIAAISKEENLEESKAFVIWILEQYYNLPRDEAINMTTDSSGDRRIDAFIEREDAITIVQCKLFNDEKREIGEKEISIFKGCIDWGQVPFLVGRCNRGTVSGTV